MSSSLHGVLHVLESTTRKAAPLAISSGKLIVDNSANTQPISATALPLPLAAATEAKQDSIISAFTGKATEAKQDSIISAFTGKATEAKQDSAISELQGIGSSLAGTLSVTQSVSKSESYVNNASTVAVNDLSAAFDCSNHRKLVIVGTISSGLSPIEVHISHNNSTYYRAGYFNISPDPATGEFAMIIDCPFKYIKLKYFVNATVTALISGSN